MMGKIIACLCTEGSEFVERKLDDLVHEERTVVAMPLSRQEGGKRGWNLVPMWSDWL